MRLKENNGSTDLFLSDQCKEIIHTLVIGLYTCYEIRYQSYIMYELTSVQFNSISNNFVLFTAMCYD